MSSARRYVPLLFYVGLKVLFRFGDIEKCSADSRVQRVETSQAQYDEALARGEAIPDDQMLPFGQSSYGRTFDMDRALKTLNETELYNRVTCSLCSDIPNEPMKTDVSLSKSWRGFVTLKRRFWAGFGMSLWR